MARLLLPGGSYSARSIIASAQKCINYYPEVNQKPAIVPLTHYQRPGLVPIVNVGTGPIRGLWQASTGRGYCVSGSQFFLINSDFSSTFLGNITAGRTNPCSFTDNGFNWVLVDGSATGYTGTLEGSDFAVIVDTTDTFQGADKVDFIDTYLIWNLPRSIFFGATKSNLIEFDGLFIAGKAAWPDNLQTLYVNRREIVLFGSLKSEVWYDAGLANFPFAALPGAYVEHGVTAKYSVAHQDISIFFLSSNLQGHGMVLRYRGYKTERISNHALEDAIRKMSKGPGITDAIGFCYQLDGHVFYVLTFPAGDQTWVFDDTIGASEPEMAWHQEAWTDGSGVLHRSRMNCHAVMYNRNVVGDWQNATLYQPDLDTYVDTVNGVVYPITCIRTFPYMTTARIAGGTQTVHVDGRRVQFSAFRADIESGLGPVQTDGQPAQIILRWSDDRGRTFGTDVLQSNGFPGEYLTQPQWLGMGIARDRIFELSHKIAGPAALNGAWVDAEVLGT